MNTNSWKTGFLLTLSFALTMAATRPAPAEEPGEAFLNALRDREYYDVALDYLTKMEMSTIVRPEFRITIAYERGVTLQSFARTERNPTERVKILDQAKAAFEAFANAQQGHYKASSAKNQMANLLVDRARVKMEFAKKKGTPPEKQKALLDEARASFEESYKVFSSSREFLKERLERLPKGQLDESDPNQKRLSVVRDQFRADYLQTRLLIPKIREEKAETYPEDSEERMKLLKEAAEEYGNTYKIYRRKVAGMYARMYQGGCYVKMKDHKEALSYFGDIFEQDDDDPVFRLLKKKTLILAVESWLGQEDKALYSDAIQKIGGQIDKLPPVDAREPEWLFLRLSLARAYKALADDAKTAKEKGNGLRLAAQHGRFVTKYPSDYKRQAQEFVASLGGVDLGPEEKPEPKTFSQAQEAGKEALDLWQTEKLKVVNLTKQVAAESDANVKQQLTQQLQQSKTHVAELPGQSLAYFQKALVLADETVTDDDISVVRYFICFLLFSEQQYHEAALVGEFVATRFSQSPGAEACAQIALAAYVQVYNGAKDIDGSTEAEWIVRLGDHVINTWPEKPITVVAANTLIAFMINDKRIDEALKYLERIPVDSPNRGEAELSTGQAMWSVYVTGSNKLRKIGPPAGSSAAKETARLEKIKNDGKEILKAGIERMRKSALSSTLLTAALSLAQIYVDTGEVAAAVKLLEDAEVGPLTALANKHPAAGKPGFAVDTYKTALRAYSASLESAADKAGVMDKAKKVMESLQKLMGNTPEGRQNLVNTYYRLGNDIKQQFENTPANQRQGMADGVVSFLREIRDGSDELGMHIFSANSLSKLGESMQGDDANKFYNEAVKGFDLILSRGAKQPDWLSDDVKAQVRSRRTTTLALLGQHQQALKGFAEMLREKQTMLNVQVKAAEALQAWAAKSKNADKFKTAIMGDVKEKGKNVIWGWGKISQVTARRQDLRAIFFEARYNLSVCRYQYGKLKKSDKEMGNALKSVETLYRLYPKLGGDAWTAKFDQLAKDIQKGLKKPNQGLAAWKSKKKS